MRSRPGFIKPVIVAELLVVMLLAGVGTSFAVDPHVVTPNATPGATVTPLPSSSLVIKGYQLIVIFNTGITQVTGVIVTVHNNDAAAAHSGTVQVAFDQGISHLTGNGSVNLIAGATGNVTISLGPIAIGQYTVRAIVIQTP